MLIVRVHGTPAPQGSKRALPNGRVIEQSSRVGPWRSAVKAACLVGAELGRPLSGDLGVGLIFMMARPKDHYGRYGVLRDDAPIFVQKSPDLDKLCRSTLDGMTQGGALEDDRFVVRLIAEKIWCRPDAAGVLIGVSAPGQLYSGFNTMLTMVEEERG